jgi:hypothetical protein
MTQVVTKLSVQALSSWFATDCNTGYARYACYLAYSSLAAWRAASTRTITGHFRAACFTCVNTSFTSGHKVPTFTAGMNKQVADSSQSVAQRYAGWHCMLEVLSSDVTCSS